MDDIKKDIEEVLNDIDTLVTGETFTKKGIKQLKTLASEYRRILKQRDSLRDALLHKPKDSEEESEEWLRKWNSKQ